MLELLAKGQENVLRPSMQDKDQGAIKAQLERTSLLSGLGIGDLRQPFVWIEAHPFTYLVNDGADEAIIKTKENFFPLDTRLM